MPKIDFDMSPSIIASVVQVARKALAFKPAKMELSG